jgi:glutathionyl-hydroquinone reductase
MWNKETDTVTSNKIKCLPLNVFLVCNFSDFFENLLQCLDLEPDPLNEQLVEFVDIAYDEVSPKHYKEEEVGTENVV